MTLTCAVVPLSLPERRELVRIARDAIGAVLGIVPPPTLHLPTAGLLSAAGAFVTIYGGGELRGCVGHVAARDPLHVTVATAARAAAFEDSRFSPVRAEEWSGLDVEISRLTIPRPAAPEAVVPGQHGLYIVREPFRGLLLPQVATRCQWTREEFLDETCRKAGLEAGAWRDPDIEILVFEAEVFRS